MLRLNEVAKRYGDEIALDGLTLELEPGEVFGLLGPNGAGKTTAVKLATGLLAPDEGRVTVDGGDPRSAGTRRRIGVAPQSLALYVDLTARENLRFFGTLQDLSGSALDLAVDRCLDFVGLSARGDDRASTYSGGMKRRLNLACALVHDPPLLLLDEPTVGIDPQSRNRIFESIEAMQRRGRTIVYTTHYMEEAERLCDRVGIIDHGRLLSIDTVEGLIDTHGGRGALVVEDAAGVEERVETETPLEDLLRLHEDRTLRRFRLETPTLERVFLNLTGRELRDE